MNNRIVTATDSEKKTCDFCTLKDMEGRVVWKEYDEKERLLWYAVVPQDPQIFGHMVVTMPGPPCIRDIEEVGENQLYILERLAIGTWKVAKAIRSIRCVERAYLARLGESPRVHLHYHVIPRYGFLNEREIDDWSRDHRLENGSIEWRRFYSRPTMGFLNPEGFRYLGEMERTFNETKLRLGTPPPAELLGEIADKLRSLF